MNEVVLYVVEYEIREMIVLVNMIFIICKIESELCSPTYPH